MMTYDDRLTFINQVDLKLFGKEDVDMKPEDSKEKEAEVTKELNEKEIPENLRKYLPEISSQFTPLRHCITLRRQSHARPLP